jgi:hypothetical protein
MQEKKPAPKPVKDDPWEDLVVSILSVNQYSLEHTYQALEGLRTEGLSDPSNLAHWGQVEIVDRLKAAGCDRGPFMTNLFALRLCNLGTLIEHRGVEECVKIIWGRDRRAIQDLLLPVNGIGPKVIANFCLLRELGIP